MKNSIQDRTDGSGPDVQSDWCHVQQVGHHFLVLEAVAQARNPDEPIIHWRCDIPVALCLVDRKTSAIALRGTGSSRVRCRGTTVAQRSIVHPPGNSFRSHADSQRLPFDWKTSGCLDLRSANPSRKNVAGMDGDRGFMDCNAVLPAFSGCVHRLARWRNAERFLGRPESRPIR